MPRQRMAPGEHGKITDSRRGEIFYATTYVRLHSGKLREREASSRKSAEDARRELKRRIAVELAAGEPTGVINQRTTLSELFEAWVATKVVEDGLRPQTERKYRDVWRLHGHNQLGALRIAELATSRADAHFRELPVSAGKLARIVLGGMYGLAARHDVIRSSPIRETKLPKSESKEIRGLTAIEFEQVRQAVATYAAPTAGRSGPRRGAMLAAYVELLAATGARPSEVLAIRWHEVDLLADPPTATITGTLLDHGVIPGRPLHRQDSRKGDAPPHTVTLPAFGVQVLTELYGETGPDGVVLKNRDGGLVSASNIASSLRDALEPHEDLRWVTPHSVRRSVATVVRDGLGVEAAQQQLSHAQLATTEGHYVQRVTAGPDARAVLEKWAGNGT
ncbi:MAG: tyrosine-type recombinase/integrase [Mycobacterium sp.]|nr:tyrosine-type recombinase/integrase [Mycobacterium sp.]